MINIDGLKSIVENENLYEKIDEFFEYIREFRRNSFSIIKGIVVEEPDYERLLELFNKCENMEEIMLKLGDILHDLNEESACLAVDNCFCKIRFIRKDIVAYDIGRNKNNKELRNKSLCDLYEDIDKVSFYFVKSRIDSIINPLETKTNSNRHSFLGWLFD